MLEKARSRSSLRYTREGKRNTVSHCAFSKCKWANSSLRFQSAKPACVGILLSHVLVEDQRERICFRGSHLNIFVLIHICNRLFTWFASSRHFVSATPESKGYHIRML